MSTVMTDLVTRQRIAAGLAAEARHQIDDLDPAFAALAPATSSPSSASKAASGAPVTSSACTSSAAGAAAAPRPAVTSTSSPGTASSPNTV
jgi:hypothetical protein